MEQDGEAHFGQHVECLQVMCEIFPQLIVTLRFTYKLVGWTEQVLPPRHAAQQRPHRSVTRLALHADRRPAGRRLARRRQHFPEHKTTDHGLACGECFSDALLDCASEVAGGGGGAGVRAEHAQVLLCAPASILCPTHPLRLWICLGLRGTILFLARCTQPHDMT